MMKCKEALAESGGDMEKAQEWLRAKGLSSAGKKSDRATTEGVISTYVHTGSRLGVMVEVNCETDFVAKGDKFAELAKAVAMQLAASPTVEFVRADEIDDEVKERERQAEMQSEDLAGKPDNIKEKMVEGRLGKILKTKVLMDQPYIRDPSMTVDELVKGYISTIGENIQIARFARFNLGETNTVEKEPEDLNAAVAEAIAQTSSSSQPVRPSTASKSRTLSHPCHSPTARARSRRPLLMSPRRRRRTWSLSPCPPRRGTTRSKFGPWSRTSRRTTRSSSTSSSRRASRCPS